MLQPQLLYRRAFYYYLMASNFLLRLAWTHKLSPHLRKHQLAAFMFVVLEGFRWGAPGGVCVCLGGDREGVRLERKSALLLVAGQRRTSGV